MVGRRCSGAKRLFAALKADPAALRATILGSRCGHGPFRAIDPRERMREAFERKARC